MSDPGPLSWRTDVDIPEIGAVAGDFLVLDPLDAEAPLTVVRRVDRETLMRIHHQLWRRLSVCARAIGAPCPPPPSPPSTPGSPRRCHLRVLH